LVLRASVVPQDLLPCPPRRSSDLGCTHSPLLTGAISYVTGEEVTLVSSAEETAKDVYRTLVAHDLERSRDAGPPRHRFLATGSAEPFEHLARRFLGPEVLSVEAL